MNRYSTEVPLFQEGTRWFGKCWHYHEKLKYEFDVEFDIPVTYPMTSPEIALPELDGKTAKVSYIFISTVYNALFCESEANYFLERK